MILHAITGLALIVSIQSFGGGFITIPVNDVHVLSLLQDFYYPSLGVSAENLECRVTAARVQVMNGFNYHITLEVSGQECEVEILTKPWENFRQTTKDTCKSLVNPEPEPCRDLSKYCQWATEHTCGRTYWSQNCARTCDDQ